MQRDTRGRKAVDPQTDLEKRVKHITENHSWRKTNLPLWKVLADEFRDAYQVDGFSKGIDLIRTERYEQINKHGLDATDPHPESQRYYISNELISAAVYVVTDAECFYPTSWGRDLRKSLDSKFERMTREGYKIETCRIAGALLATEIDRLYALKESNEYIPITQQLPQIGEAVECLHENGSTFTGSYETERACMLSTVASGAGRLGEGFINRDVDNLPEEDVTHWRPIKNTD